jgi:hypothetical protein
MLDAVVDGGLVIGPREPFHAAVTAPLMSSSSISSMFWSSSRLGSDQAPRDADWPLHDATGTCSHGGLSLEAYLELLSH